MKLPDITNKNVLIIGCPASGKTYVSDLLADDQHILIHTDDYIGYGYHDSMYKCLEDIVKIIKSDKKTIVEGIQGYRLLRKGVELDNYYPDIVIELIISENKMYEVYENQREIDKAVYLSGFNEMHNKILLDYKLMENPNPPEWITIFNKY
jgi:hypothetical protein